MVSRVFWICLSITSALLISKGYLWQLWSLYHQQGLLSQRILEQQAEIEKTTGQIKKAQDIDFIEQIARDRYGLVKDGDLVFLFQEGPGH